MSITDDPKFQKVVEALRARADKSDNPEVKALFRNALGHIERGAVYHQALGNFVTQFALVETTLQQALWMAADVASTIARAIFSGLKVEGCLQFIKRVADAKKWKPAQQQRLKEITDRLGPLNKLRNDILHHGVTIDLSTPDSWSFSNRHFAHIPEKIREFSVTPSLLNDASADLSKLFYLSMVLSFYAHDPKWGRKVEKQMEQFLTPAWRYKSPQPAKTAGKSLQTRQKRPRRRHASPAKP